MSGRNRTALVSLAGLAPVKRTITAPVFLLFRIEQEPKYRADNRTDDDKCSHADKPIPHFAPILLSIKILVHRIVSPNL